MSIREKIRAFVIDNFLFGEDQGLKDDSSFLEGGILDSTGIMQLVAFLEEEFSVTVKDEELTPENLDSIQRVTNFLERRGLAGVTGQAAN